MFAALLDGTDCPDALPGLALVVGLDVADQVAPLGLAVRACLYTRTINKHTLCSVKCAVNLLIQYKI